ncbi:MAG: DUF1800 domain-containing protein [Candidatus Andeanibacterium colombiense]|uniref:DUF1800 domain-containing protein n=1 Tax=Candidatus Andeanibacterium colombiense TaxID=3121345 RepID=A0AAJ6BLY9_9SPHN|nr:MAG: DUF1800 domain-containing protein [Sphingomonadaceae bacterium]
MNKFGLGAKPSDNVGNDPRGWLLDQLERFEILPPPLRTQPSKAELMERLRSYSEAQKNSGKAGPPAMAADTARAIQRQLQQSYVDAASARVTAATLTDAPFVERLVHFWSNHFAISADKQNVQTLAGNYEFNAIRVHVLGNFHDLLTAAVTHPAMMLYLDQTKSIGPRSPFGQRRARHETAGRKDGLNENLAREIMELHTLGVRTGYNQTDVTEFARALTGWTIAGIGREDMTGTAESGASVFVDALHEPGSRTILGKSYAEGGAGQATAVLVDLSNNPATAQHIATKLARHFIADDPPSKAVARLKQAFLDSGGDLPTVYHALIDGPEGWSNATTKFRTPWDWVLAALRATGDDGQTNAPSARGMLQQLGQPIWQPGSPAGWGDTAADWASPGALLSRVELAQRISGRVGDRLDARTLAKTALADALTPATIAAIDQSEQSTLGLALLLASPEFMRR